MRVNKLYCIVNQFRIGQDWLGQVRLGQVRIGQVRLGQVRLGQVRIGQVRLGQVRLGQVRLVRLGQLGQARLGQARLGKLLQVIFETLEIHYLVGSRPSCCRCRQDNASQGSRLCDAVHVGQECDPSITQYHSNNLEKDSFYI